MTSETLAVTLDVTRITTGGRVRCCVVAKLGDDVLHVDELNLASSRNRAQFLDAVAERVANREVRFQRGDYEQLLITHAAELASAADGGGDGRSGERRETRAALDHVGLEVLGELDDQSILLWTRGPRKKFRIRSPAQWANEEMLQAVGQAGADRLWLEKGNPPNGEVTPAELRRAVAITAASAPRLTTRNLLGQGVWMHDERLLLVNGARAMLYDGERFEIVEHPRLGKKVIGFDAERAWHPGLENAVREMDGETARQLLGRLRDLAALWNWSHPQDPAVIAALIVATFVQACWSWRPLVSIIGASDVGKSTFLQELLAPTLGDWTIAADRSTEAGLRQAIGHDAAPVVIDEFDKYRHRQQVLELFRTASRGGTILRGTQSQAGLEFGVRHVGWFAAIESGDVWGQDRNRFIRLELRPPKNRGALVLPGPSELGELGHGLMAAALWAALDAFRLADAIKRTRLLGVPGRLIESFSVPAAMDAVLRLGRGATEEDGIAMLATMIANRANLEDQGEADEARLLRDILAAVVRVANTTSTNGRNSTVYVERSVAQLLRRLLLPHTVMGSGTDLSELLEAKGLRLVVPRDGSKRRLFIAHEIVRRELLEGTRWGRDVQIDQLLARLRGAERSQQRCGGQRPWGVAVPVDCLGLSE